MENGHRGAARYEALLLVTTVMWSLSFIWTKVVTNTGMASEVYLFLRYTLAAALIFPFALRHLGSLTKKELMTGIAMGLIIFVGMLLQTAGLALTTPSNSSFITTAYVVIAPFTTWLMMKRRPSRVTYMAVLLCLGGIYILNIRPGERIGLNLGNALTLMCAFMWAVQLTYTSIAGEYMKPVVLSFLSFSVTGLGGLLTALIRGSLGATTRGQISGSALAIVLTALFPTLVANLAQVHAQHRVDPNKAAVIYTLEAVFATVISILIGLETWSPTVLAGGGLIICAVLLTQLGGNKENG